MASYRVLIKPSAAKEIEAADRKKDRQRIVAVKSTVHFRADFDPIAQRTIVVEAPGAHPCRLDGLPYRNLRPGVRLGAGGRPFRLA